MKSNESIADLPFYESKPAYTFGVYTSTTPDDTGRRILKNYIVIKDQFKNVVAFTGLEAFAFPYDGNTPDPDNNTTKPLNLNYICRSLNYIFDIHRVDSLSQITMPMIRDFWCHYASEPKHPRDVDDEMQEYTDKYKSQQSIDSCIYAVSHFFAQLSAASVVMIHVDDLLKEDIVLRNSRIPGRKIEHLALIPKFSKEAKTCVRREQFRDILPPVMQVILDEAIRHDPMIYGAIEFQNTTGARPGSAMSMRQANSPISTTPGITIERAGTRVTGIQIDINTEYILRSDGVDIGGIKKERTIDVYHGFFKEFIKAYEHHMSLLTTQYASKIEQAYLPMFVDYRGKAMTYHTYHNRLKSLITEHVRPRLLASDDPVLLVTGLKLLNQTLAPHAFRHYFTCRLVLAGLNEDQIKFYRGDASIDSAETYVKNKGLIIQMTENAHANAIEELRRLRH